eukprot:Clim_evm8s50 gene=Clim_evmTU8s50
MSMKTADQIFSVRNRVALVTGGNDGFGNRVVRALIASGARVYFTSRDTKQGDEVAKKLGPDCQCVPTSGDLTNLQTLRQVTDYVREREPCLHILVNNTAMTHRHDHFQPSGDENYRAFTKTISVNLQAPFHLTQLLHPLLKQAAETSGHASVLNISSTSGQKVPVYDMFAYSSSKAGLNHLTRHLANHLGPDRITVNALALGIFKSKRITDEMLEEYVKKVPLRRAGDDDDAAAAVLYFCSPAGKYVTGTTMAIDGGALIGSSL